LYKALGSSRRVVHESLSRSCLTRHLGEPDGRTAVGDLNSLWSPHETHTPNAIADVRPQGNTQRNSAEHRLGIVFTSVP
jgi:hypothetical protein